MQSVTDTDTQLYVVVTVVNVISSETTAANIYFSNEGFGAR